MTASINAANFLMLSVFGIAAVGYLLGRITIKGISLGTAGVFVIALVYGAFFGANFNSKFVIEEIPEKKKAAIGVRAMKLSAKDSLEQVYVMADGEDKIITYKEKEVSLQKLKNGTRDQKGTKIRV